MRKLQSQGVHHLTIIGTGCVHHLAISVSAATFQQAVERLDERGIRHSEVKDRGFIDSIYFQDPLDYNIDQVHLADAIEALATHSRESLSEDRSPKQPYRVEERSHG